MVKVGRHAAVHLLLAFACSPSSLGEYLTIRIKSEYLTTPKNNKEYLTTWSTFDHLQCETRHQKYLTIQRPYIQEWVAILHLPTPPPIAMDHTARRNRPAVQRKLYEEKKSKSGFYNKQHDKTVEEAVKRVLKKGRVNCGPHARSLIAQAHMNGELDKLGGSSLVMVIDDNTYQSKSSDTAVVFSCSRCNYVMDRFYHAQMHYRRIHMQQGKPMPLKRKFPQSSSSASSSASSTPERPRKKPQDGKDKGFLDEKVKEGAKFVYFGDMFEGAKSKRWQEIQEKMFVSPLSSSSSPWASFSSPVFMSPMSSLSTASSHGGDSESSSQLLYSDVEDLVPEYDGGGQDEEFDLLL